MPDNIFLNLCDFIASLSEKQLRLFEEKYLHVTDKVIDKINARYDQLERERRFAHYLRTGE